MTAVWLIEWPADRQSPVRYWHPTEGHVIDPHHAIRLARMEDAAAIIKREGLFAGALPVEHIFGLAAPTPLPDCPAGGALTEATLAGMVCEARNTYEEHGQFDFDDHCARSLLKQFAALSDCPAGGASGDIEAVKKAAYKQGWNDREEDLLVRAQRIFPAGGASIPEGWQLVPTKALVDLVTILPPPPIEVDGKVREYHDPDAAKHLLKVAEIARAMLASAPSAPSGAWRSIDSAPKDGTSILAACADGRMMIWRGDLLATALDTNAPSHLQFPATHWMPLPSPPSAGEEG